MSGQWHGGKGSISRKPSDQKSKEELKLRDDLWRAKPEDKPAIREALDKLVAAKS